MESTPLVANETFLSLIWQITSRMIYLRFNVTDCVALRVGKMETRPSSFSSPLLCRIRNPARQSSMTLQHRRAGELSRDFRREHTDRQKGTGENLNNVLRRFANTTRKLLKKKIKESLAATWQTRAARPSALFGYARFPRDVPECAECNHSFDLFWLFCISLCARCADLGSRLLGGTEL
jgi:hypothetical protein